MKDDLNDVKERLKAKEYRLTPQREVILRVLLENSNTHLSADDLYWLVKKKNPDVGLATVYRMLELLEELEIVNRLDSGEGRSRFEMRAPGQLHYHHHLICLQCGEITEFISDGLESIEQSVSKKYDFDVTDHCLMFYGYCQKCRSKGQS